MIEGIVGEQGHAGSGNNQLPLRDEHRLDKLEQFPRGVRDAHVSTRGEGLERVCLMIGLEAPNIAFLDLFNSG